MSSIKSISLRLDVYRESIPSVTVQPIFFAVYDMQLEAPEASLANETYSDTLSLDYKLMSPHEPGGTSMLPLRLLSEESQ